jgi:hypothetical protein
VTINGLSTAALESVLGHTIKSYTRLDDDTIILHLDDGMDLHIDALPKPHPSATPAWIRAWTVT